MIFLNIFGGLLCLFLGGEALVKSAVTIAKRFNVSKALIAVTIVAYGTSSPELLITLKANLSHHSEIALGNVIGSNIANILLVLGLAVLFMPITVNKNLLKFDMKYLMIATIALSLFILTGQISRIEALIFLAILLIYSYSTLQRHDADNDALREHQADEIEEQIGVKLNLFTAAIVFIVGVVLLVFGSNILVIGASDFARMFHISEAAIAVTIVAIGGSAPEIATSVIAAYRKHADIAIGNVIGSNIFNILGVLGISAAIKDMPTAVYDVDLDHYTTTSSLAMFDIWVMVFVTILLYLFVRRNLLITRIKGVIFLIIYILYISWQFI